MCSSSFHPNFRLSQSTRPIRSSASDSASQRFLYTVLSIETTSSMRCGVRRRDEEQHFGHHVQDCGVQCSFGDFALGGSDFYTGSGCCATGKSFSSESIFSILTLIQIREKAEEKFLAVALSDSSVTLESTGDLNVEATPEDAAAVYLSIVEELAYSIPEFGVPSVEPVLVDKMNTLLQRTFATDKSSNDSSSMLFWVSTLLRLCVIHFPTLPQTTGPKPGAFDPSRLLIAICCISLSPLLSNPFYSSDTQPNTKPLQNPSSLQTHALDIASSILDSIPDESRHQCIRILRDRLPAPFHVQNDSRLLFLFGPITDSSLPQPPTQQQQQQQPANQSPLPIPTSSTSAPSSTPLPTPTPPKDDNPTSLENRLYLQSRGTLVPYHLRAWEMLGEAAPIVGANDTAVGLGYFGARRSRA